LKKHPSPPSVVVVPQRRQQSQLRKLSLKSPRLVDDQPRENLERASFQALRMMMLL
jgi:hypothetical protein